MTQAQHDQGIGAFEWGLLVGYDEQQKTYAVRHPRDKTEYTVPFGGFGYTDPVNWYHVIVPVEPEPADLQQVAIQSLKHAVAFAHSGFTASLLQEATGSLQAALEADRKPSRISKQL
jgi:hypothetical protein